MKCAFAWILRAVAIGDDVIACLNLTAYNLLFPFLNAVSEHVLSLCAFQLLCQRCAQYIREYTPFACVSVVQSQICRGNTM